MCFTSLYRAGLCLCLLYTGGVTASPHTPFTLYEFMEQVWQKSPTLQAAQADLEATQARANGAKQPLYNPSISLESEQSEINRTAVGYSQTLDWNGRQPLLEQQAQQRVEQNQSRLQGIRQQITTECLTALSRYHLAHRQLRLAIKGGELMQQFSETLQRRLYAGDATTLDMTLAQVAYSEALMTQADRQAELIAARTTLQTISRLTQDAWPQLPEIITAPPASRVEQSIENLPELRQLYQQITIARNQVALAQREGRAEPTVSFQAGREGNDNVISLNLEIPLFIRNDYKAETTAVHHEQTSAEQRYQAAHQQSLARLNGALAQFSNRHQAWQSWLKRGQKAQKQQMVLLKRMWQSGELSAGEYLLQAKQNIDIQAAATTLYSELQLSHINWLDASGTTENWLKRVLEPLNSGVKP